MSESIVEMARRMCAAHACKDCPAHEGDNSGICIVLQIASVITADKQIAALQDWAAANPPKTYKDVLLERIPKAIPYNNGITNLCRQYVFGGKCPYHVNSVKCMDCWNEPYKEG